MITKDTLVLLRIPFSFFLLPVFLFAWSQAPEWEGWRVALIFAILHLLVYPSSNGYNSYHDKDDDAIGGLKNPPKVSKQLLHTANAMDFSSVLLALLISWPFALMIGVYILASRMYSNIRIRIKKRPILGLLWVVFFQGFFVYWLVQHGITDVHLGQEAFLFQWKGKLVASLLLVAIYPLTQVYQHDSDARAGVRTYSRMVGYIGTFITTAIAFALANVLAYFYFLDQHGALTAFWVMQLYFIPVTAYFVYWFVLVMKNRQAANFDHTMRMNFLASLCLNLLFATFLISGL